MPAYAEIPKASRRGLRPDSKKAAVAQWSRPTMANLFSTLVLAYLGIGVITAVTQSVATPCAGRSNVIGAHGTALLGTAIRGLTWPVDAYTQLVKEEMPVSYFLFASDCKWEGQPPPLRVFAKPSGGSCPKGTEPFRGERCLIPPRAKYEYVGKVAGAQCPSGTYAIKDEPGRCALQSVLAPSSRALLPPAEGVQNGEPSYRVDRSVDRGRCDVGWLRLDSEVCVLPSIPKAAGQACPAGLVAWKPPASLPIEPKDEVCRLPR